jgi:hypothetical protein
MFAGTDVVRELDSEWCVWETHSRAGSSPASSQNGLGVAVTWFRDFVEETLTGCGCVEAIEIGLLYKAANRLVGSNGHNVG